VRVVGAPPAVGVDAHRHVRLQAPVLHSLE
jgi:hypothetical protein